MSMLHRVLKIPSADRGSDRWHVSAPVDTLAYAFGWIWILVPLELLQNRRATDHLGFLFVVLGLTFVHRHYTLPYVYLDRQVFSRYPRRFVFFPALMLLGFLASPYVWKTSFRPGIAGVALIAGVWNLWHIYMQKYGILRLYDAKAGGATCVPPWVDRLYILAWVPLYLVWLAPRYRHLITGYFPTAEELALPVLYALADAQPVVLVPAVGLVVFSLLAFFFASGRAGGCARRHA